MSVFNFRDASLTVNAVDLSDHVKSVTLNHEADGLESTAMGATFKARIAGLQDWSMDVEFLQDFAATEVDATLNTLVGAAAFSVVLKATSSAVSATNPSWTGNAILTSYPPLDGSVGDIAVTRARFEGAGTLTRATT